MRAPASAAVAEVLPAINGIGLTDPLAEALGARFRLHRYPAPLDRNGSVLVALGAAVDQPLLDKLPQVRLVASLGAGYDHVDVSALRSRGIQLCNTPGLTDDCVADTAMGLLIAVQRRLVSADRFLRAGTWLQGRYPLTPRFSGRRLGILGLGRIGMALARRAAGFDLEIGYHNRRARPELPFRYFETLEALASWCEYLVVACPLSQETRHRVDVGVLRALGPEGIIVNIARGPVIDEAALIAALEAREIAGAGLDVFEAEPQVPARLVNLENTVLTPHLAGGSRETWEACYAAVVANIEHFFRTGRPLTPVNLNEEP